MANLTVGARVCFLSILKLHQSVPSSWKELVFFFFLFLFLLCFRVNFSCHSWPSLMCVTLVKVTTSLGSCIRNTVTWKARIHNITVTSLRIHSKNGSLYSPIVISALSTKTYPSQLRHTSPFLCHPPFSIIHYEEGLPLHLRSFWAILSYLS